MTQNQNNPLTLFAPFWGCEVDATETRLLLEEGEKTFAQLPLVDPPGVYFDQRNDICELFSDVNPEGDALHIVASSNNIHHATYFMVKSVSDRVDDVTYVHIDKHPDAVVDPRGMECATFGLGSFVHEIRRLPNVSQLVTLGCIPCWENGYDPFVAFDQVFGPEEVSDFSFLEGRNVYVSIDGDALADWRGFMAGGQMSYQSLRENLSEIAKVGNIVGLDMTGFCRTRDYFDNHPSQLELTKRVFDLTREVMSYTE